jgi:hypothetical protein
LAGPSSAPTGRPELALPACLSPSLRRAARRFAEIVCPPEVRTGQRTDRVLGELSLMLGALPPAARKGLAAALIGLDQGARLYPPSRGRRLARLDDRVAAAYIRAVLTRPGVTGELARRLKGVVTMCYYDLAEVQREIGYDPAPYIAAVSRRRLESYGADIRAHEEAARRLGGEIPPRGADPDAGADPVAGER